MDFFSAVPSAPLSVAVDDTDDPFARAIRDRFSTVHGGLLTARLPTPDHPPPTFPPPSSPFQSLSLSTAVVVNPRPPSLTRLGPPTSQGATTVTPTLPESPSLAGFPSTQPLELPSLISLSGTLLIDIRTPSAFDAKRITTATSLSVPSTLLKRPLFTLDKLATMIPSKRAMEKFLTWRSAERIIVIDADSSTLTSTSNLMGLLRKFRSEAFEGDLTWVKGGFHAVQRAASTQPDIAKLVTTAPPAIDHHGTSTSLPRSCDLPHSAFEQSSTTIASHRAPSVSHQTPLECQDAAPGPSSTRIVAANPFYDNIRQISELSQGITERIPLVLRPDVCRRAAELPFSWLKTLASRSPSENGEALAMQFYKVEFAEQRRLMGIMEEHSRQSQLGIAPNMVNFPFSITAGLEKGSKNRYQNIWPFEHARVRLNQTDKDGCDYVNASFVQPPATKKRYIATQGPMTDTFADFWSLVWEQNAHVIVMLTKRFEGASVKCDTYWPTCLNQERQFGHHIVRAISDSDSSEDENPAATRDGFNFEPIEHPPRTKGAADVVKRKFILSNLLSPGSPGREITHFQYLDWPDLGVPSDPEGFLNLIREVNRVNGPTEDAPIVLHCSAGVGRTGGYILVDAVLDGIRQEMRQEIADSSSQESAIEMDVDETSSAEDRSSLEFQPRDRLESTSSMPMSEGSSQLFFLTRNTFGQPPSIQGALSLAAPGSASPKRHQRPVVNRRRVSQRLKVSDSQLEGPYEPSIFPELGAEPQKASTLGSSASMSPGQSGQSDASTPSTGPTSISGTPPKELVPITNSAFDFMPPRTPQHNANPLVCLHRMAEPVRQVLEGMREQRMSLCQTLRQYVFAHVAIIEGAIQMLDEPDAFSPRVQTLGAENFVLSKRPSGKRRHRSDSSLEESSRSVTQRVSRAVRNLD